MVDSGLSGSNETSYSSGMCSTSTGTKAPSSYATPPETEALRRLSDGLESIFERPRAGAGSSFSNAVIVAGDGLEVPVHRCVVAAWSPFFGASFAGSESGARLELAEVFGVSSFLGVLPFLFLGKRKKMERSTPVRKPHTSTSDLLTWSETPPPHDSVAPGSASSRSNSRSHQLSRNRRVPVRSWHGQVMVDVREFYVKDGKSLPGKKGISLPIDQWNKLVKYMSEIDKALADA